MNCRRWHGLGMWVLLAALLPVSRVTAEGVADFGLSKLIPADACMVVHARSHDGQKFLDEQYARVWSVVEKQNFGTDIKRLLEQSIGTQMAEGEFDTHWQKMMDLCSGVEWSSLGKRESAFAMKIGWPTTEMVFLFRPPADQIEKDIEGLSRILKSMAEMAPQDLTVATDGDGAQVVHRLSVSNAPVPMSLTLAREKDTLIIGFGTAFVEQCLTLARSGEGSTLGSTPRFQEAVKAIAAPQDELTFLDVDKLMGQIRSVISSALGMAGEFAGDDPEAKAEIDRVRSITSKMIDAVDMFEYMVASKATDGMRTTVDQVTVLRSDAASRLLYKPFFGTGTVDNPLKYVPKEAGGVTVSSGVDLASLYTAVLDFVKAEVPEAAEGLATWDAMQQEMSLNVQQDVLSWIQGNMVMFTIPGPTAYSAPESAVFVRVHDESKARAMMDRLTDTIEPMLTQNNGMIKDAEIEEAEGFRSVVHPMLAMLKVKAPTYGVKDGWLCIGSSPEVLAKSFDVASGKAENFGANERFRKEGIAPGSNLVALSFTDQTKFGEELGTMIQSMTGMLGMFGPPELRTNPAAQTALRMATKLGAVVKAINFLQSSAAVSTFDGKQLRTKMVANYREPPAPQRPPGSESGAETGGGTNGG